MHFYINTLPPLAPILIPPPISIPLLQVSQELVLPPLLTYSDDVLYNWTYLNPPSTSHTPISIPDSDSTTDPLFLPPAPVPTIDNLRCLTLFTSTNDESEFYLSSARIELAGVRALALMRESMDEAFVGDALALRRIAQYLKQLAIVLHEMTTLLLRVREGCDPEFFYRQIRPWFKGQDSMPGARKWVFEGIEDVEGLKSPTELSGPSAGQSALIHAIDIFLGVDHYSTNAGKQDAAAVLRSTSSTQPTSPPPASANAPTGPTPSQPAFLARMQLYMPRHHRAFLRHLSANPRPLRALVEQVTSPATDSPGMGHARNVDLLEGYNEAVRALREFRDAHLRIVALYIIGPSRRVDAGTRMRPGHYHGPLPSPTVSPSTSTSSVSDLSSSGSSASLPSSDGCTSQSSVSSSAIASLRDQEAAVLEKGTGGTLLMPFLKSVRDRTAEAELTDRA